jgi:outer membrane receptor for monomeric catechols
MYATALPLFALKSRVKSVIQKIIVFFCTLLPLVSQAEPPLRTTAEATTAAVQAIAQPVAAKAVQQIPFKTPTQSVGTATPAHSGQRDSYDMSDPLWDLSQILNVVSQDLFAPHGVTAFADALRHVPGIVCHSTDGWRYKAGVRGFVVAADHYNRVARNRSHSECAEVIRFSSW